jgi:hypothetical protein
MYETIKLLDRRLLLKINSMHDPLLDEVMWFFSNTWPTILIILTVAFAFYKKYHAKKAVEVIGEVDCVSTLAHVAAMNDWVLPLIITNTTGEAHQEVILEGLRHPILEYYIGTNCVPSNFTTKSGLFVLAEKEFELVLLRLRTKT